MTLFSLYAVFKFFDKDYVNILLKTYFLFLGVCAMAATLHPFVKDEIKRFISESRFKSWTKIHKIDKKVPILSDLFQLENFKTEGDIVLLFCAAISLVVASTYIYSKHWCFNNILGICFSIQGIENIGLSSVKVGVIVLVRVFHIQSLSRKSKAIPNYPTRFAFVAHSRVALMIADIKTYESCMLARCLIFCDIRCLYRNRTS